jgi:hypothetical protein
MRGRVLPCDMDFNLHMNNAVYNAYTDISRIGWFTRLLHGNASWYRKEGFIANGGLSFFFLREMRFMQPYELRTRAVGCDAKWVQVGTHGAGLLHSVLDELQPGAAAGGAGVAPKHAAQDGRHPAAGADADTTPPPHSPRSGSSSAGGRRKVR